VRGFFVAMLLVAAGVGAQEPTEIYDCVDDPDGADFCSDSTAVLVDGSCGTTFNRYHGRIAWPALRNVGPVTISVKTRRIQFGTTSLPLYIEVVPRVPGESQGCRTWGAVGGFLILVAQGGPDCGGTWESVGPISLASFGVPLGSLYHLQAVFFESIPDDSGRVSFHSVGFSCLQVTSHPTAVGSATWTNVKALFR